MSVNIRKLALELLASYELEQRYVNLLISSKKVSNLSPEERGALTALLYTTVEKKLTYDYLISSFSQRSASDIDPYVRDCLRLGLCQILDMNSIPDFAAVNETVKLARHDGERGFMNAVLRRAVNAKNCLPFPDKSKNPSRYMSIYYSVPLSTVKFLVGIFGEAGCEEFLRASVPDGALSLTVNEGKISRDALLAKLDAYGALPALYSDNGIEIKESVPPRSLPGFAEGEFFVQDEAGRLSAQALAADTCDRIIDVCSAPGGKALAAAIKAKSGKVYSFDIHESKLSLIRDSAERIGLSNIECRALDATAPDAALFGEADKVICDVPCSGLGVFGKKPDLRYKNINSIEELYPLQYSILCESAKYLKCGGVIVYSTCTVNPHENEEITDRFISEHPQFAYESFAITKMNFSGSKITLLPHIHRTDGFYIAKMRKIR